MRAIVRVAPLAALALACADDSSLYRITALAGVPAPAGSRFPSLASDSTGRTVLSWTEPGADSTVSVRFSVLGTDGAWSRPATLVRDTGLLMNWADFGSVIPANDGRLVGQWLRRSPMRHAYQLALATSADNGTTWSAPVIPHDRVRMGEHGFVSAFPMADGAMGIQYLDGTHNPDSVRAMTLKHIELTASGTVAAARALDVRVCDCCQTDAAMTSRGPIVVYRDRSVDEIRDIAVVRMIDGAWGAPVRVHADDWNIDGCPVNGPAIAAEKDNVVVAWYTAARDTARVRVAFSPYAGASFGTPVDIDVGPAALGRVDVVLTHTGDALVFWLHRSSGDRAQIRAVAVGRDGRIKWRATLGETDAGRPSGFPRAARAGNDVVVAWTEAGSATQVRVARIQ